MLVIARRRFRKVDPVRKVFNHVMEHGSDPRPEYHRATPECPHPERWSMIDSMTAEVEVLELLGTLVTTLKPQLASATWVGGRRWDLNFQSGEIVALPEGDDAAKTALTKFARLDKSAGLLGRGIVRFDLRVPGKMIVRLPRAPGEPIVPAPPQQQG